MLLRICIFVAKTQMIKIGLKISVSKCIKQKSSMISGMEYIVGVWLHTWNYPIWAGFHRYHCRLIDLIFKKKVPIVLSLLIFFYVNAQVFCLVFGSVFFYHERSQERNVVTEKHFIRWKWGHKWNVHKKNAKIKLPLKCIK